MLVTKLTDRRRLVLPTGTGTGRWVILRQSVFNRLSPSNDLWRLCHQFSSLTLSNDSVQLQLERAIYYFGDEATAADAITICEMMKRRTAIIPRPQNAPIPIPIARHVCRPMTIVKYPIGSLNNIPGTILFFGSGKLLGPSLPLPAGLRSAMACGSTE
eukprot:Selendium_serpulae@DN946_c0_g1_i1.p1